jgi:hypothetical protein
MNTEQNILARLPILAMALSGVLGGITGSLITLKLTEHPDTNQKAQRTLRAARLLLTDKAGNIRLAISGDPPALAIVDKNQKPKVILTYNDKDNCSEFTMRSGPEAQGLDISVKPDSSQLILETDKGKIIANVDKADKTAAIVSFWGENTVSQLANESASFLDVKRKKNEASFDVDEEGATLNLKEASSASVSVGAVSTVNKVTGTSTKKPASIAIFKSNGDLLWENPEYFRFCKKKAPR